MKNCNIKEKDMTIHIGGVDTNDYSIYVNKFDHRLVRHDRLHQKFVIIVFDDSTSISSFIRMKRRFERNERKIYGKRKANDYKLFTMIYHVPKLSIDSVILNIDKQMTTLLKNGWNRLQYVVTNEIDAYIQRI